MTCFDINEFFSKPYAERNLILFDDNIIRPDRLTSEKVINILTGGAAGVSLVTGIGTIGGPVGTVIGYLAGGSIVSLLGIILGKKDKLYPKPVLKEINLIVVIPKKWSSDFKLPPGHPKEKVVYAGHPINIKQFVPVADFHRFLLEDKFLEIIRILESLGAKKIYLENIDKENQKILAGISGNVLEEEIGIKASYSKEKYSSLKWEAEYKGHDNPKLPDDLIWYPHEKTWNHVVESRLKYNSQSFTLTLQYNDDYGINIDLKTKIDKLGFKLGGEFQNYKSVNWIIKGSY